jgi:hypothetical protein
MNITLERLPVFLDAFFEVFWKSGVLLGAALYVNVLLLKNSADVRRIVLSMAVIAMFVAALASTVLPRWTAVTPAWLGLGDQTAASFESVEPAIVAVSAIDQELPSRSEASRSGHSRSEPWD